MCRDHIKTWYEGTGLSLHITIKKAKRMPRAIRKYGLTETVKRITGRFSKWISRA